ncbi:MAG: hypothetical protein KJO13_08210, partial [Gammaproteobacteria bacterium]|nr:hypothetical protein [Gammaproteobacteria bacterium]
LTLTRYKHLTEALEAREQELGVDFVVDYASWLAPDPSHHIYPRNLYTPGVEGGSPLTYCGEGIGELIGKDRWEGCTPERYNVDGTAERLIKAGVDEIVFVDLTTSGVRFFKTWDVVNMARQVVAKHNRETGADIKVWWVNDPTDLMTESYPEEPAGWTLSLGDFEKDRTVPLEGRPNPVSSDPRLAEFHVKGIEEHFTPGVSMAETGILLVNHATRLNNQFFDPKIDDTVVLNRNIKGLLQERHPELKEQNILGGWFGMKTPNPFVELGPRTTSRFERTREMRGENLGDARLYEKRNLFPDGDMGYRYWEALDELKNNGVKQIIVAFPQIMVDSVLNLVEVPNQIAKEIGFKNWLYFDTLDFETYPDVGHPFADFWGMGVDTECKAADGSGDVVQCCLTMGGCGDDARRPYPPPRQTQINKVRKDLDPSLAYDVSEFGHLGYDPEQGPPNLDAPVQDQYRGTWTVWTPPNDNPDVGKFLADKVVDFVTSPRPGRAVGPVYLGKRSLQVDTGKRL